MNLWKISTLSLAALLAVVVSTSGVRLAEAHPQPTMENAKELLKEAHQKLKGAAQDKGGHRVKAMELTVQAIDEVQKGIDYANAHEDE